MVNHSACNALCALGYFSNPLMSHIYNYVMSTSLDQLEGKKEKFPEVKGIL